MSGVVDLQLAGLLALESATSTSFTWAGEEYPCTASPERDGQRLDDGGFKQVRRLTIAVRTSLFSDSSGMPKKGHTIEFKRNPDAEPRAYKIKEVTDYYGASMELHCEDPHAHA